MQKIALEKANIISEILVPSLLDHRCRCPSKCVVFMENGDPRKTNFLESSGHQIYVAIDNFHENLTCKISVPKHFLKYHLTFYSVKATGSYGTTS